ncbi:MAG TPA: hypothetical protein VKB27_04240 [Gammaproteobacteria bacterium]|nr:hypothetical protein [Gammaproteobacteria bacterium]
MKNLLTGVMLVLAAAGCDSFENMTELFEKQKLVTEAIKNETGWESQVGFNFNNGVFTNVTVLLNANDVRDRKVTDLERVLVKIVLDNFKSKPQTIYIQIATTP